MPFSKQYSPSRANARYQAEQDLSPDDFNEWQANVQKGGDVNWRPSAVSKAKMPGQADDFTTALGRDTGFEETPVRTGKRPGIYVPEGGAFSKPEEQEFNGLDSKGMTQAGNDPFTHRVDPKSYGGDDSNFQTPEERLQKKFAPQLAKMSPEEKEIQYRKAKGMDVPQGLALRQKLSGVKEILGAANEFAPMPGQPKGNSFTTNTGHPDDFMSGVMRNLDGDDGELTIGPRKGALESAPSSEVAFNGKGPLSPSPKNAPFGTPPPSPYGAASMPGQSVEDQIKRGVLEQALGIKLPDPVDPRKRQRDDEDRQFVLDQRTSERQLLQIKLDQARADLAEKTMTPVERARRNVELRGLEKQANEAAETPTEKLLREADELGAREKVNSAQAHLKGEYTPDQINAANDRSRDAYRQMYTTNRSQGASHEEAQRMALEDINSERRAKKLQPLSPADFGSDRTITDMRPQTLQGIAQKAGAESPEDAVDLANSAATDSWMKKDDGDTSRGVTGGDVLKATALGALNPVGIIPTLGYYANKALQPASKKELMKDPEFMKTQKGRAIAKLVAEGYTPQQADAMYETYSFKK